MQTLFAPYASLSTMIEGEESNEAAIIKPLSMVFLVLPLMFFIIIFVLFMQCMFISNEGAYLLLLI